jgi:HPt (histidine-containing phosphotransfer) domain-containing protein
MSGDELAIEYRVNLLAKLARIEALRGKLAGSSAPVAHVAELLRDLHSIAGSAQAFGMPAVSDAARAAEQYVADHCNGAPAAPGAAQWARLRTLLDALEKSLPAA